MRDINIILNIRIQQSPFTITLQFPIFLFLALHSKNFPSPLPSPSLTFMLTYSYFTSDKDKILRCTNMQIRWLMVDRYNLQNNNKFDLGINLDNCKQSQLHLSLDSWHPLMSSNRDTLEEKRLKIVLWTTYVCLKYYWQINFKS